MSGQHPRDRALDAAMRHADTFDHDHEYSLAYYTAFRDGAIFMHQYLANEATR